MNRREALAAGSKFYDSAEPCHNGHMGPRWTSTRKCVACEKEREAQFRPCKVAGCSGNSHYTAKGYRGFCSAHVQRWERHGDPLAGSTSPGALVKWLQEHASHEGEGCLPWPFGSTHSGYGLVLYNGVHMNASRAMCFIAHGEPPTPKHHAAHSCGKGHLGCVHPGHLSWKTKVENEADRIIHGTTNRGERQGRSKLTEDQVRRIFKLSRVMTNRDIARIFDVHEGTIGAIIRRENWAWLDVA